MFARYAAIVKNLRGVVVADLSDDTVWNRIRWLTRKFRYRDLGLPPTIVSEYKTSLSKYLGGNPFRELVYPIDELKNMVKLYIGKVGFSIELAEALTLASTYISPLLIIGDKYLHQLSKLREVIIDKVLVCKPMDDNLWKLHLRIADYTILDMYEKSVTEALEVIKALTTNRMVNVENILGERELRIRKDKKRYWRILCDQGKVFLVYVDLLRLLVKLVREGAIDIGSLKEDYAAALAIVPAINLLYNVTTE